MLFKEILQRLSRFLALDELVRCDQSQSVYSWVGMCLVFFVFQRPPSNPIPTILRHTKPLTIPPLHTSKSFQPCLSDLSPKLLKPSCPSDILISNPDQPGPALLLVFRQHYHLQTIHHSSSPYQLINFSFHSFCCPPYTQSALPALFFTDFVHCLLFWIIMSRYLNVSTFKHLTHPSSLQCIPSPL